MTEQRRIKKKTDIQKTNIPKVNVQKVSISSENLNADTVLKNYWRDNEHFADFFNAVLFQGLIIIKPEELKEADTDESVILEHREQTESVKASRDVIKICKRTKRFQMELIMAGIENQEHVHYAMPLRVMGYDYSTYKKQYEDNARKYKRTHGKTKTIELERSKAILPDEEVVEGEVKNKSAESIDVASDKKIIQNEVPVQRQAEEMRLTEDEYLSRMRKTDRFIPVITVVIYYGEKPWDGALTLKDMLDIPEDVRPFVNDYKMHLVEARKSGLVLHNIENQDLFQLFEILLDRESRTQTRKESAINYVKDHNVENNVIMTVAGAANGRINYNGMKQKGEVNMISVFQETWDEGKNEGIIEGKIEGRAEGIIETGVELGLSMDDILTRLQKKLNIPMQKAEEYVKMFGKQMA